jgi:hypothetical protein
MDPFTFFTVLSTVFGAGSKIMQGGAEADAYEAQAQESIRSGREKSRVAGVKGRRLRGEQAAGLGAAGVEQEGTPLLLLMETIGETVREQESTIAGAKAEAGALRKKARASRISGAIGAVESLLPGIDLLKD